MTNIFEYSNIFVTNIYSDLRSYQFFHVKFYCTNIFVYLFVSVLECKNCLNIRIYWIICTIHISIRIFVRVKFVTRIYSDIRSCKFFDTNIFGYSVVSKFLRMSHSGIENLTVLKRTSCQS